MKPLSMLKSWFVDRGFRQKLVIVFLPMIIVPLILLSVVSLRVFTRAIIEKTMQSMTDNSRLITSRLDSVMTSATSCAAMLSIGIDNVAGQIILSGERNERNLDLINNINNQLAFALLLFPDVHSAAFMSIDGHLYSSDRSYRSDYLELAGSDLYREIAISNGRYIWNPIRERIYIEDETTGVERRELLKTLGKKVIASNTGETLGALFVDVSTTVITDMYRSLSCSDSTEYLIVDGNGTVVISFPGALEEDASRSADILDWIIDSGEEATIFNVDGGKLLLTSLEYPAVQWHIASVSPLETLTKDVDAVRRISIVLMSICLFFVFVGTNLVGRLITLPVYQLQKDMAEVEHGALNTRFTVSSRDEIGRLGMGFNTMLGRIGELVEAVGQQEKMKREYELALMQEQIKPHFLYNTLDTSAMLVDMGRLKEARYVIRSLSRFYRSVLSEGKEIVSIEEEMKIVRDYLAIQQFRFSDVFDYTIDIDPGIEQVDIVKLTVQPLVENAIYHGLRPATERGRLSVRGVREDGSALIEVYDDGVGIGAPVLSELRSVFEGNRQNSRGQANFGLRNVHERIQLYFGSEHGLSIDSREGTFTKVTLSVPFVTKEYSDARYADSR